MKKFLIICIIIIFLIAAAFIIYILSGIDNSLTVREYELKSSKLSKTVKITFVSDLHGSRFGENNCELVEMIKASEPDAVLLGGDMFDEESRMETTKDFISQITPLYPVYGVMGNHEYRMDEHSASELKQLYRDLGVVLLDNESTVLEIGDERINICGTDPFMGDDDWRDRTVRDADEANYTVVINHRPDQWPLFTDAEVDLMLSGHAHGGQWILPGVFNGILAPNQGFFPKYAGGLYSLEGEMTLVVSRGLALENTRVPRVYNPPELVNITITTASV